MSTKPIRCALCDRDNDVMSLCEMHRTLTNISQLVRAGAWSDWVGDQHQQMMTNAALAEQPHERGYSLYVQLAAMLTVKDVEFADAGEESFGDWLADNWLLEFGDDGRGGIGGVAA